MISLVLVRPQMGENIGAAARAMLNFGFKDLRIVSPRDGWPNERAIDMAAGAKNVVENAKIYDNLQSALADKQYVYATTARSREVEKETIILQEIKKNISQNSAIVFGPERTGLTNEDVSLCDAILTIPVNEEYPSLNLAQAVALVSYELNSVMGRVIANSNSEFDSPHPIPLPKGEGGAKHNLYSLFEYLESELDKRNFWQVPHKKDKMCNNIRNMLQKAQLTEQEVNTMFGIIRTLSEKE